MEYRKLISFGNNSFVISLPKSWVIQNKLKKGDLIHITEQSHDLILSGKDAEKEQVDKVKVITVDGKNLALVEREINSSYILNHRTIILKGEELRGNIRVFQTFFQNLIALEVMEQTPTSLVAKDFLNMSKVSVEELVHKMDIVTRAMFIESSEEFSTQNYENVNERDRDVNRLYFLLYRTVLYNMDNPLNALRHFKLKTVDLVNFLFSGYYLEGIADEVRRTARYASQLNINQPEKEALKRFLQHINEYYLETMKAFYAKNVDLALGISEHKKELNNELDTFEKKNQGVEFYGSTIGRMRRLISFIHSLGRIVYQGCNYYDELLPALPGERR